MIIMGSSIITYCGKKSSAEASEPASIIDQTDNKMIRDVVKNQTERMHSLRLMHYLGVNLNMKER